MTQTQEAGTVPVLDLGELLEIDELWAVIVWNDDVNTFAHVTKALVEILRHSTVRAEQLTLRVHNTGKALVAVRPKDEAVTAVHQFHARGIQATVEPA
ncbi:MAG TPA: ATP-dependent Clp protease adaptor ClpS [Acidimicrobiales bacterium]|jgi:ATP-dependent Clp protease adaptor protein ClpS